MWQSIHMHFCRFAGSYVPPTDPLMQAFDGSLFFFHGKDGGFYNLLSEQGKYQVCHLFQLGIACPATHEI
jgi:hypothetical protein